MNIKELTYYIQSANINFLIGSGASRPYLATLGSIEKLLTRLNDDMHSHPEPKYKIAEASIYKAFYDSVIAPNRFLKSQYLICLKYMVLSIGVIGIII